MNLEQSINDKLTLVPNNPINGKENKTIKRVLYTMCPLFLIDTFLFSYV